MNQNQKLPEIPETAEKLFPSKWLKVIDLDGRPWKMTIHSIQYEEVWDRDEKAKIPKPTITFEKTKKHLILSPMKRDGFVQATGTSKVADWVGQQVTIAPGKAHNGKDTIVISKPKMAQNSASAAKQPQTGQQDPATVTDAETQFLRRMVEKTGFSLAEVQASIKALGYDDTWIPEKEKEIEALLVDGLSDNTGDEW